MPSIGEIQKYFSDRGWKLYSRECINSKDYIYAECPNGHEVKTCWNKFQQGRRCVECSGRKKKTLEWLRPEFEKRGWKLLATKYKNCETPLEAICPRGHTTSISWGHLKQGTGCNMCYKPPYYEVNQAFVDRDWQLLSTEYKNALKPLEAICSKGHKLNIAYSHFSHGGGCAECSGKKPKTQEFITDYFEKAGYKVLEPYTACQVPFLVKCLEGHETRMSWNNFSNGNRCKICAECGPVSRISQEWLDYKKIPKEFREFSVFCGDKKFKVDGFDPITNTIYEFLGDFWHGNPNRFNQNDTHPVVGKTFGQLFDETVERLFLLRRHGFNLIIVWEEGYRNGFAFC